MATFEIILNLASPLYAFPASEANFTNWAALRVEGTSNLKRHIFDVDETISQIWYVFQGSNAPNDWDDYKAGHSFTLELQQFYTGPR